VPEGSRLDLLRRFQSHDNSQHISAFAELFFFAYFAKAGFRTEAHPETESEVRTRPDMLVSDPSGYRFYFEATAVFASKEDAAAASIKNQIYQYLNDSLINRCFFLDVTVLGHSASTPPLKKAKDFIESEMTKYNPERLLDTDFEQLPLAVFNHDDWHIHFRLIPRQKYGDTGKEIRPIGIISTGVVLGDTRKLLYNSLANKAKRYGDLDLPYVIAIDTVHDFPHSTSEIDIFNAILGTEAITLEIGSEKEPEVRRQIDGLWMGPQGPRNTKVSAILWADSLLPWSVTRCELVLYHNPWAARAIDKQRLPFTYAYFEPSVLRKDSGIPTNEIMKLPADWPYS